MKAKAPTKKPASRPAQSAPVAERGNNDAEILKDLSRRLSEVVYYNPALTFLIPIQDDLNAFADKKAAAARSASPPIDMADPDHDCDRMDDMTTIQYVANFLFSYRYKSRRKLRQAIETTIREIDRLEAEEKKVGAS